MEPETSLYTEQDFITGLICGWWRRTSLHDPQISDLSNWDTEMGEYGGSTGLEEKEKITNSLLNIVSLSCLGGESWIETKGESEELQYRKF